MSNFLQSQREGDDAQEKSDKIKQVIRLSEQSGETYSAEKIDFMIKVGSLIGDRHYAFQAVHWLKSCAGMSKANDGWVLRYEKKFEAQMALNFIGHAVKQAMEVENVHTAYNGKLIDSLRIPDRKNGDITLKAQIKRF